jgi:hypothetical protein
MKKARRLVYDPGGAMSFRSPAREAATPLDLRDFREASAPSAVWTTYHPTWRDNVTDRILGFFGEKPSIATRTRVERIMGNATPATSDFVSPIDMTPFGAVFSANEAHRKYKLGNYRGAAWDASGAVPGGVLSALGMGGKAVKAVGALRRTGDVSIARRGLAEWRPQSGLPKYRPGKGLPFQSSVGYLPQGARGLVPFDREYAKRQSDGAVRQLLGTATTPNGRQITIHAADRMVNPPRGRAIMSPEEVDRVLDGATRIVGRADHPLGSTLKVENSNMPGRPQVVVDEKTGQRAVTVINPKRR